jgi:ATP-binding cassette subfamily B protein
MVKIMNTTAIPAKHNIARLAKISVYLRPHKLTILGIFLSLLITSSTVLLISKALQYFIDKGLVANDLANLDFALFILIMIIVTLALFTFVRFYLVTYLGERVIADIKSDIYNHILKLSPGFFEETKTGDIISRMTADTTLLLAIIGSSISVAMRNAVMLVGGIIMLAATNLYLTMIIFILIPIIILPIILLGKKMKRLAKDSQDKVAEITSICEQSLGLIKTIQSYLRQDYESQRFSLKIDEQLKTAVKRIAWRGLMTAAVISLAFGGIAFVLWLGAHQVLANKISPGELSAFIYISVLCAAATAALSEVVGDLYKAAGASERLFEFLHVEPEICEAAEPLFLPANAAGKIEFKKVVFAYRSNKKKLVLDAINFTVEPRKVTAIVGKSGAGKSTILNLLERFYDIDSGSILIDNIDIRQLKLKELRGLFTYVPQDPAIFSESVLNNILYGNPQASFEEVKQAAEAACCMDFIEKMPDGFHSYLGEKGVKLSGGQKQRIAIARAILHDPKILLLDEATSSLDSENEGLVHNAINNLMRNRTTIVIAHRLSTIMSADKIIVLDKGRVLEEGSHKTLIKKPGGLYAKLAKMQFHSNA